MSAACLSAPMPTFAGAATAPNLFAAPDRPDLKLPAEYSAWLDQTDRIVHVSSNWDCVVAAAHRSEEILARPVGWFIADANLRECYRSLFTRVRDEHRGVRFGVRCDIGEDARALQLTVIPLSAGAIELRWSYFDGNPARRFLPVKPHHFDEGDLLRMCGWCHAVNLGSTWQRLEQAAPALGLLQHGSLPGITHGICPNCCDSVATESAATRSLQVAV